MSKFESLKVVIGRMSWERCKMQNAQPACQNGEGEAVFFRPGLGMSLPAPPVFLLLLLPGRSERDRCAEKSTREAMPHWGGQVEE